MRIDRYLIKVLLTGRSEPITRRFDSEEKAREDLDAISTAQDQGSMVKLDWLRMNGGMVEAAWIEDASTNIAAA